MIRRLFGKKPLPPLRLKDFVEAAVRPGRSKKHINARLYALTEQEGWMYFKNSLVNAMLEYHRADNELAMAGKESKGAARIASGIANVIDMMTEVENINLAEEEKAEKQRRADVELARKEPDDV